MSEATPTGVARLVDLRDEPLSVDEVHRAVADPRAGGVSLFVGTVRDHDHGQGVEALAYSAHPTVVAQMHTVVRGVAARFAMVDEAAEEDRGTSRSREPATSRANGGTGLLGLAVVHRVGDLQIGDLAVVAAASAAHRGQAFEACRALIDDLKASVPIWKHQAFDDGTDEWVGAP